MAQDQDKPMSQYDIFAKEELTEAIDEIKRLK